MDTNETEKPCANEKWSIRNWNWNWTAESHMKNAIRIEVLHLFRCFTHTHTNITILMIYPIVFSLKHEILVAQIPIFKGCADHGSPCSLWNPITVNRSSVFLLEWNHHFSSFTIHPWSFFAPWNVRWAPRPNAALGSRPVRACRVVLRCWKHWRT